MEGKQAILDFTEHMEDEDFRVLFTRVIQNQVETDDEQYHKKTLKLAMVYEKYPDAVNDVLICLTGWTYNSLYKMAKGIHRDCINDEDNLKEEGYDPYDISLHDVAFCGYLNEA